MPGSENLRICVTCGTQFDLTLEETLEKCRMCEDPRQFVPPTGHSFTSLAQMRGKYENKILQDPVEERMWSIWTEPAFAIGERAIFLETPAGNVLWDCIAYLDQKTVDFINSKGGLKAIVVSHPHFWTSHLDWADEFDCPVYLAADDSEWLQIHRQDKNGRRRLIKGITEEIIPGVTTVKLGGHFPGSLILHWDNKIFTADTIAVTLSGLGAQDSAPDANCFSFMWAYPNFIPLSPSTMHTMWQRIKPFEFTSVHSLFVGRDLRNPNAKAIVLNDMKLNARHSGHEKHALFEEDWHYDREASKKILPMAKGPAVLQKLEASF